MTLLRAEDLRLRIGDATILESVSLAVDAGELVGLIGPNGAGKTTLLRVLARLLTPDGGRVLCRERPLARFAPDALAREIAYLAQGATVHWPITAERLVALGRLPHRKHWPRIASEREAVDRALDATAATPLRFRAFATLSGGEQARVMLARALAVEAPILLVDEPIAALDPHHQIHVLDLLRATARRGAGVVAVLHDLTLAGRFCDRLILLDRGRIHAEGSPAAVLSDANLAATYRITTAHGRHEGQDYVLPWDRVPAP